MYIRGQTSAEIVALYVDDLIITPEVMEAVKQGLQCKFKMKDMGRLHYCLGTSNIQDGSGSIR